MCLIIVNLFAPLSLGRNERNNVIVQKNTALAADSATIGDANNCNDTADICVWLKGVTQSSGTVQATGAALTGVGIQMYTAKKNNTNGLLFAIALIKDPSGNIVDMLTNQSATMPGEKPVFEPTTTLSYKGNDEWLYQDLNFIVKNLKPSTTYTIKLTAVRMTDSIDIQNLEEKPISDVIYTTYPINFSNFSSASPIAKGETSLTTPAAGTIGASASDADIATSAKAPPQVMPACGVIPPQTGTIMGCIAQGLYYVIFTPTSYLFALAGKFFDFTFAYSVNDTSYRNQFVIQGWGLVRDFCNMFFIFVLLYIAFSTILNLHGFKTKDMVIRVIVIGILINFSLLATQIIIDSSNILARVFYNSQAITVTQPGGNPANGAAATNQLGPNGEIQLSAALVDKVDPQNLIIYADKVSDLDSNTGTGIDTSGGESRGIGVGTFILVTLLASAVNVVGFLVFLSVGLVFVARVIGLWFAIVFVPFAFFSYTVPAMEDIEMVGWKKWWPETLKLAFLAPLFIFFMYLILSFLQKGLSIVAADRLSGIDWVVATIIPFLFIMVMLWKAKEFAGKFSGTLGSSVTGAAAAIGGLAIGGAALGAAAIGRMGGGLAARASRGETATQKYEAGTAKGVSKFTGFVGSKLQLGKVYGAKNPTTGQVSGGIGSVLNRTQKNVSAVDHARHEMDEAKKKAKVEGINNLSATQEEKVEKEYTKSKRADVEADIKKGNVAGVPSEDAYKTNPDNRKKAEEEYLKNNPTVAKNNMTLSDEDQQKAESSYVLMNPNKGGTPLSEADKKLARDEYLNRNPNKGILKLSDNDKKSIDSQLNVEYSKVLKVAADVKIKEDYAKVKTDSAKGVSGISRAVAQSNTGSMDVRNLSQVKQDARESVFTKLATGVMASSAGAFRSLLKTGGNVNYGTSQKDFIKDLGHTISEAIKPLAKVDLSHVGESASSAKKDTGGGEHH